MKRRGARGLWLLVVVPAFLLATRVHAEDAFLPVEWSAPPECPDAANVNRSVVENLGKVPVESKVRARARVVRTKDGFVLNLGVTTGPVTGDRTLNADRCETLSDATALIVALAIDPEAVALHKASVQDASFVLDAPPGDVYVADAGADAPLLDSSTARHPNVPQPVSAPRASTSDSQISAALRGGIESGRLPNATGVFDVAAGFQISKIAFELRGQYAIAQRTQVPAGPAGLFQYWSVGAHGCLRWKVEAFRLGPCLGATVDRFSAEGRNILRPRSSAVTWATLALAGYGRWDVAGPFFVDLRLEGAWLPSRPTIVIDPDTTVFEPSIISVSSALGLGLAWDL